MSEEKFVDFAGLLYYDTKIKAYIDNVTSALSNSSATKEEVDMIKARLAELESLSTAVTRNTAQIEELFRENSENESSMIDLFKKYEDLSLKVENAQTRLDVAATKEDTATLQGHIDLILDDIKELEEAFKIDHVTLEDVRIALEQKADKSYVDSIVTPSVDLTGYATEEFVIKKIAEAELAGQDVDLSAYYTKSETEAKIQEAVDAIKVPDVSELATKEELQAVQNVAGSNSIKLMQLDSDLVDINQKLETIPTTYATKDEVAAVSAKIDTIVIPEVPTKVSELENDAGYITAKDIPETDLSEYYTKTEVDTKIENIEHPSLDGYATEQWVKDELAKINPSIPSEYITEAELLEKGYITDAALTDYAKADSIPTKTSQLTNDSNFLTEHQDISGKADKSELEGLASTEYVDQAIANIPETDVSNLVTKEELEKVEEKIPTDYLTSIPEEYITKQELDSEGFVKSLDGYATEQFVTDAISNIKHPNPDLSNYFTKDETTSAINEAIDNIDIPEVNLEPYATKAEVFEQVAAKADNIPFTTDMFVTKPQGSFISGDNLNKMSITDILVKLLGLQPTITPEEPDEPDVPQTIVEKIMNNNLPMYQVNEAAEIIEIPYNYVTYDNTSYDAVPDSDYFYQKLDENGEVIESGYQHVSAENDSMYYLIALPQGVNFNENVSVKVWDETSNTWADVTDTLEMSSDLQFIEESLVDAEISMPTIPEGYTLWIDSSLNTCTGSDYRFIINE